MVVRGERILDKNRIISGSRKLFISIGGIRCAVISHDTSFLELLRTRYQRFESSGPAEFEILIELVTVDKLALEKTSRPLHPLIKRVNSGDNYIIKQADKLFTAVVNTFSRKVLIKMVKSADCFDSFLRMLYILILASEKGLLLRASAVSEKGRGSVFFDPDDSGKTTARVATGRTVLSDEMVVIKPHNGGFRVYGTPFCDESVSDRSSARAELGGLYYLNKDGKNSLTSLDKVQALAILYQCVPFFYSDSQLQGSIFEACRALVEAVPVYELHGEVS
jgi:hypothetical protein